MSLSIKNFNNNNNNNNNKCLEWPCPVRLSIFDVCFYRAFILLLFVESCFISAEKLSLVCCTRWLRYFVLSCSGLTVSIAAASPCFVTRPLTVS